MSTDVKEFVGACLVCTQNKVPHQPSACQHHPVAIPHRPWSHISLDFVTRLPPSDGNTVILTVVDRCPKITLFIPLSKLPSAKETAEFLLSNVFRVHGLPSDVVSDRGPQFLSPA